MKTESFWAQEPGPFWSVGTFVIGLLGLTALLLLAG